jgi:hypothetical protein
MRADWEANRDELIKFWQSAKFTHPDSLPWLFVRGRDGSLPWAAMHLGYPYKRISRHQNCGQLLTHL